MNQICRFTIPASRDLEAILDYKDYQWVSRPKSLI